MAQEDPDWDGRLRAAGLRSTVQRRAVLQALFEARHATVDELALEVQLTRPDVSLSTIYRTLEALDGAGLVTHAHLHHGSPTYHSVDEDPHMHVVCTVCGQVREAPIEVAASLVEQLHVAAGFAVDVAHLAVHGRCAACAEASVDPTHGVSDAQSHTGSDLDTRLDTQPDTHPYAHPHSHPDTHSASRSGSHRARAALAQP